MPASPQFSEPVPHAVVHLLDSALGRPMRTWEFTGKPLITIGRSDESNVQISDPYVSRVHAELRHQDGKWTIVSLGRYGVMVKGETITELAIEGETTFRLGSGGPTLRFDPTAVRRDNRMTMMFDSTVVKDIFEVDQSKIESDVNEITEGDYFQQLQKRAKQLRQQRE